MWGLIVHGCVLLSLIPIALTVAFNSYLNGFNLENVIPKDDIDLFLSSLF